MLRWFNQKQRGGRTAPSVAPVDRSHEELEFLRGQEDFDAEEMSSVLRREPSPTSAEPDLELEAPSCWPDPGATQPALLLQPRQPSVVPEGLTLASSREEGPGQLALAVIVQQHSALLSIRESALIGREDLDEEHFPEVDLSLDDAVSRRHARIYRRGGQYFIQEMGSTNGTCLNGEWVLPERDEPLKTGDIILLGEVSELQVLTVSFGTELTDEDRQIGDLLTQVLDVGGAERTSDWRPPPGGARNGAPLDMLDIALSRGVEAGLLEGESEWDLPTVRPEWRLREFDGLELPSLVEPYR